MSSRYTHGHHESVLRSHLWRTAQNSAAYLLPHLDTGARVLDVGCGPGTITTDFARIVAPGEVVGLDSASEVVDRATATTDLPGNVHFVVGDVYTLGFDDDYFTVVHAHQVLQHLSDPIRALVEMRRVCAPNGLVAARDADFGSIIYFPADPVLEHWRDVYCKLARQNGGEPAGGSHLMNWAHKAGFSDVVATASNWCFSNEADREWWGSLWADRVTKSDLAAQLIESGLADRDELDAIADAWHRWSAHPSAWFAITHGEVICRPGE